MWLTRFRKESHDLFLGLFHAFSIIFIVIVSSGCTNIGSDSGISQSERREMFRQSATPSRNDVYGAIRFPSIGLTIDFEGAQGWSAPNNPGAGIQFGKVFDRSKYHTGAIRAYPISLPRKQFSSVDEFYQYIRADLESLRDKNGADVEFSVKPAGDLAPMCVLFHTKKHLTDTAISFGQNLVTDAYEYICKHPYRPSVFVNIHYSERFLFAENVDSVWVRADAMFKRMAFFD